MLTWIWRLCSLCNMGMVAGLMGCLRYVYWFCVLKFVYFWITWKQLCNDERWWVAGHLAVSQTSALQFSWHFVHWLAFLSWGSPTFSPCLFMLSYLQVQCYPLLWTSALMSWVIGMSWLRVVCPYAGILTKQTSCFFFFLFYLIPDLTHIVEC